MGLFSKYSKTSRDSAQLRQLMADSARYLMWDRNTELGFVYYLGFSMGWQVQDSSYDLGFDPSSKASIRKILDICNLYSEMPSGFEPTDDRWTNTLLTFGCALVENSISKGTSSMDSEPNEFLSKFKFHRDDVCSSWFEGFRPIPSHSQQIYLKLFQRIGSFLQEKSTNLEEAYRQGRASHELVAIVSGVALNQLIAAVNTLLPASFHFMTQVPILFSVNKKLPFQAPFTVRIFESIISQPNATIPSNKDVWSRLHHLFEHWSCSHNFRGGFEGEAGLFREVNPGFKLDKIERTALAMIASVPNIRNSNFQSNRDLFLSHCPVNRAELLDKRVTLGQFADVIFNDVEFRYGYRDNYIWANRGQALEFLAFFFYEVAINMLLPSSIESTN